MKLVDKVALSALVAIALSPVALVNPWGIQNAQAEEASIDAVDDVGEPVTPVEDLTPVETPSETPDAGVEIEAEDSGDVVEVEPVEGETTVEAEAPGAEAVSEDSAVTDSEAIGGADPDAATDVVESDGIDEAN